MQVRWAKPGYFSGESFGCSLHLFSFSPLVNCISAPLINMPAISGEAALQTIAGRFTKYETNV